MNIRCPHCQTVFRVNPARIPPSGARAKCARCGQTFAVAPPGPATSAAGAGTASTSSPPQPRGGTTAPASPAAAPQGRAEPREKNGDAAPGPRPAPAGSTPSEAATRASSPAAGAAPAPGSGAAAARAGAPVFGSRDPNQRAARIARALVSDIVAYHPERRDKSLADGNLRQEFREEILKSWDEYVAQVGADTAKGTPYFRDALNSILAKGQRIF